MEPVIHPYNPYTQYELTPGPGGAGGGSESRVIPDSVNKPLHYNYGKVETIDYIMQVCALYPGHQAALVANVIKYVSRAPMKGDKEKDLKKAQWYLNRLIDTL